MVHCKEYTEILIAEKSNLGTAKKIGVYFHWCICRACQKFKKQSKRIDQDIDSILSTKSDVFVLDEQTKLNIQNSIDLNFNKKE